VVVVAAAMAVAEDTTAKGSNAEEMSEGAVQLGPVHCPLSPYMPCTSSVKLSGTILRSGVNFALTT
jgi:hypothetical protein